MHIYLGLGIILYVYNSDMWILFSDLQLQLLDERQSLNVLRFLQAINV